MKQGGPGSFATVQRKAEMDNPVDDYVGKRGLLEYRSLNDDEMWVPIKVVGVNRAYGKVRLTVTPIGGKGQATVDSRRVQFESSKPIGDAP